MSEDAWIEGHFDRLEDWHKKRYLVLPGITGLLDYRLDTALPIRQLTHILLRGESTLTEGERELIAAVLPEGLPPKSPANERSAALLSWIVSALILIAPPAPLPKEPLATCAWLVS